MTDEYEYPTLAGTYRRINATELGEYRMRVRRIGTLFGVPISIRMGTLGDAIQDIVELALIAIGAIAAIIVAVVLTI